MLTVEQVMGRMHKAQRQHEEKLIDQEGSKEGKYRGLVGKILSQDLEIINQKTQIG